MKNNHKYSAVAGILMFVLAALCSVSLLLVAIDFGGMTPAHNSVFFRFGNMLTKVYGLCSVCIPVFLIAAGMQCFYARWSARNGVVLAGSAIPFFTLDAMEHIVRIISSTDSGNVMWVKIGSTVLFGGMIIAAEFILLSILGEFIANLLERKNKGEEVVFVSDDSDDAEDTEDESDEDDSEEAVILEQTEEKIQAEEVKSEKKQPEVAEAVKTEEIKETVEIEEKSEEDSKKQSEEDVFDFSNDKIFQEQKNILKDLIAVGRTEEEKAELYAETESETESEIQEDETTEVHVSDENQLENQETAETDTFVENSEAFDDETATEEESPFVLPEAETLTFDDEDVFEENNEESFEEAEDKTFVPDVIDNPVDDIEFDEPVLVDEYRFGDAQNEEDTFAEDTSFDEPVLQEETLPVSEDDFAADDLSPAPASDDGFVDPAIFLESEEPEADTNDYIEIEDIFSQMDEDAAENPVMKKNEAEAEEGSLEEEEENSSEDPLFRQQILKEADEIDAVAQDFENEADDENQDEAVEIYNIDEEIDSEETVDVTDAFMGEEDDEDRSLNGVEGIDDDQFVISGDTVSDSADDSEFEIPDFVDEDELEPSDSDDSSEPEMTDEGISIDDELSEEDKKAGITAEDDPYERKQKRTIANYRISPDLLNTYENGEYWIIDEDTKQAGEYLKQTLNEFGIEAEVTGIRKGPVVTMFEILPAPGVKLSKIVSLQDNIALSLAASSVRIVAPIPGKHAVGIEVPNKKRAVVSFKEIVSEKLEKFEKMQIPVILGKDISGEPQLIDLAKTPHLLIAGSTGAGKSVCVNSMILSILYKRSPQQVKLVLIDPKVVELKLYNDIPHLLTPVITEPKKALQALQYCLCEMERRYALLDGMGVRDIVSYNKRIQERRIATEKLPYIVVVIDEFADLMATTGRELESTIARLAAMSRAVGIHLVLATQRPSVNVITGLIKANIPSRIAFMVASRQDSQIIIDGIGAEKLLGKGDMLYSSATDPFPTRIQGTLVGDDEVERVVNEVKQYGEPEYIDDEIFVEDEDEESTGPGLFSDGEDPLYDQALQIVVQAGKASASYIQRRLKIGYNRAARLVEDMEARGIVGPANGSKPREVIHTPS